MKIPPQFTTIPNDYPAPTWEKPGLYWNPDYLAYCERRDRGSHQLVQHGAVRVEQTPPAPTTPEREKVHTCEVCGEMFTTRKRIRVGNKICVECRNIKSKRAQHTPSRARKERAA